MKKDKKTRIPFEEFDTERLPDSTKKLMQDIHPDYINVEKVSTKVGNFYGYSFGVPMDKRCLVQGATHVKFFLPFKKADKHVHINTKLRDRIAIAAMSSKIIGTHVEEGTTLASMIAEDSYKFADAMLKARDKKLK